MTESDRTSTSLNLSPRAASSLDNPPHVVAILDAGSQYGKVIDRRVRELAVECHLLPVSTPIAQLSSYRAIIISGGPQRYPTGYATLPIV